MNKAPIAESIVHTDDLKQRIVSIDGLRNSSDPDGKVVANIVDWGDGTKETIPAGISKATKTYGRDGDYQVVVRAVDNLGRESAPQTLPIRLDNEQRERDAEAERKRIEDAKRASELDAKKRAAEDAARIEAETRVVKEAAETARMEAEAATRKRLAEESQKVEMARKAEAAKAEEMQAAEAAKSEAARKLAEAEARAKQLAGAEQKGSKGPSNPASKSEGANAPGEPSEFKDVTTGRPVRPISFKKPSYPRQALQAQEEGSVRVQFTVDPNGKTKDLNVIADKNGYAFKSPVLDAIKKATFHPAMIDGVPVEQQLVYEVSFVINKD